MSRQFIASSLSFCLLLHAAGNTKEISQFMSDANGHTIRFLRNKGQQQFIAVVNAILDTCNMSVTRNMPSSGFNEQTYWYHENRQADANSYLTFYSDRQTSDDEALAQTLNCTATVAHNLLYTVPIPGISVDDFYWVNYLWIAPLAFLAVGVIAFKVHEANPCRACTLSQTESPV